MKNQDDFQPNIFKENQNLKLILIKIVDNVFPQLISKCTSFTISKGVCWLNKLNQCSWDQLGTDVSSSGAKAGTGVMIENPQFESAAYQDKIQHHLGF